MDSRNPDKLIAEVKQEQETRGELATEALQWFLDGNVGELFPRGDVVDKLSDKLDITNRQANTAIADTVGDIVDPVQQILKGNKKYVGVIDYKIFNDEGAYGYIDFDDIKGERKRVVCAKCVEDCTYDSNVNHATQGEGTSNVDATWQQLLNKVTSHYTTSHTKPPSEINPGASLNNGTTISGNTAFHQGNENSISHDSISGVSASDHHIKTTSASGLTDVSADGVSGAHHSKTTSGSELTDVSVDSNSDAHHSKTTSTSEISNITTGNNTALGSSAGNGQTDETATGFEAAGQNTGDFVTATGFQAARNNSKDFVTATGDRAARNNSGRSVTATGLTAAQANTGTNVTAIGQDAAHDNTGTAVTAIGRQAARFNDGNGVIALGRQAAFNNSQNDIMIITDRDGNRRMELDLDNGNLSIEGSLNQNASL